MKRYLTILMMLSAVLTGCGCGTSSRNIPASSLLESDQMDRRRSLGIERGANVEFKHHMEVVQLPSKVLEKSETSLTEVKSLLDNSSLSTGLSYWQPSHEQVSTLFDVIADPKTEKGRTIRQDSSKLMCQSFGVAVRGRNAVLYNFLPLYADRHRHSFYVSVVRTMHRHWPMSFVVLVYVDNGEVVWLDESDSQA